MKKPTNSDQLPFQAWLVQAKVMQLPWEKIQPKQEICGMGKGEELEGLKLQARNEKDRPIPDRKDISTYLKSTIFYGSKKL